MKEKLIALYKEYKQKESKLSKNQKADYQARIGILIERVGGKKTWDVIEQLQKEGVIGG